MPSEGQFLEDRSGVTCPEFGPKEVFLWGFGAHALGRAQTFSVHQKALLDRARPGVPPRTGVTSPESLPSASVSPSLGVLRNGDQCDTEQLDVIKPPKELVKPHLCFRKLRSNQMPAGSSV